MTASFANNFGNYRIGLDGDGRFTETYNPFNGGISVTINGTWEFSDGINKFTLIDNNQTRVYRIDDLSESNLNVTDLGSTNSTELQLVPE
ncbi:MAG: hypothetical protein JKX84_05665 [Flavobacteriales bacterium]|nr:hypothetical protein [Flavobacteriales bacterium]